MERKVLGPLLVFTLVIVAAVALAVQVINERIFTTTSNILSSTSNPANCPSLSNFNASKDVRDFSVKIAFPGQWAATIKTFNSSQPDTAYLATDCQYTGNGTGFVYYAMWRTYGWQTFFVSAQKLDSGDGNLTVSLCEFQCPWSNSTTVQYGKVSVLGTWA
jgi:hypothetical protein